MSKISKDYRGDTLQLQIPAEHVEDFKVMVKRAMATWQNPPPYLVLFQDELLCQVRIMAPTYRQYQD